MFENEKSIHDYAARITAGASQQAKSRQIKSEYPSAGGLRRPVTFFRSPRLVAVGAAVVVSLGALGLLILKAPERPKPEDSRQAQARDQKDGVARTSIDPQQPPTNDRPGEEKESATAQHDRGKSAGAGTETTATFLLLAGGTRGGESYTTLKIPGRTETVQLELDPPNDNCAVFSAVLQKESGEELQRWERLRAQRDYSSLKVARLRVHASSLESAGYVIRIECVSGINNPGPAAKYHFKVEKK
jgi:hypothetical protein